MNEKQSKFTSTDGRPSLEQFLSANSNEHLERLYKQTAGKGDETRFLESLIELERSKQEKQLSEAVIHANRSMTCATWVLVICAIVQISVTFFQQGSKGPSNGTTKIEQTSSLLSDNAIRQLKANGLTEDEILRCDGYTNAEIKAAHESSIKVH